MNLHLSHPLSRVLRSLHRTASDEWCSLPSCSTRHGGGPGGVGVDQHQRGDLQEGQHRRRRSRPSEARIDPVFTRQVSQDHHYQHPPTGHQLRPVRVQQPSTNSLARRVLVEMQRPATPPSTETWSPRPNGRLSDSRTPPERLVIEKRAMPESGV